MMWLLRRMVFVGADGFIVAWNGWDVDAFVKAFPEAEKTLRYYLIGPNSCPMLNAAAKRAKDAGYITPGHIGNMDAREYKQRTWCRTWRLTELGRSFLTTTKVA
jgi:hypothetical protein